MNEISSYKVGNIKIGYGNFSLPPVLIGTMFYQDQTLVDRKNPEMFDENKAKKRIELQFSLGEKYKLPSMIELSATTSKSIIKYLDFYTNNFEHPFVLGGTLEARISALEHLKEKGIRSDEFIYNAISNLKNKKELEIIQKHTIKTIVILLLSSENMTSTQRYNQLIKKDPEYGASIIEKLNEFGINQILVDGGVITIESLAHILETQKMISTTLNLSVGTAPGLFLFKYASPRLNLKFHTRHRRASIFFIASWYSNFLFYGAIEDCKEVFSSTYTSYEFKKVVQKHNLKLID